MNIYEQIQQRKARCSEDVQASYDAASMLLLKMRQKRDKEGVTKAQRQTIKSLGAALDYSPHRWDLHQRIENYSVKVLLKGD